MKGGIELSKKWFGKSIDEAVTFFLDKSTFRIFTNSSISCITLIAKLNSGIESPFISIDSLNFAKPITSLLLKIMPSTNTILNPNPIAIADKAYIRGRITPYDGIEINSYATIERETQTQKDIFRKSIISPISYLDSLCPAVIHVINPLPDKLAWKKKYLGTKFDEINKIFDAVSIVGNKVSTVSIILMEFMEGYKILNNFTTHPNYLKFLQFALYELHQLHLLGYLHGDSHLGNFMVNPDIQHFSVTGEPNFKGIVKIIDFGRTLPLFPADKALILNPNYDFSLMVKEQLLPIVFPKTRQVQQAPPGAPAGQVGQAVRVVLKPDHISVLRDLMILFNKKREEYIQQILQPRLKPFYDFKDIPEMERRPDNLLRSLFPLSFGGAIVNNEDSEQLNFMLDEFDPTYDWDEGRSIVGNNLSEEEQKMTIEDFKNRFMYTLIQNDNEKTFNILQFLQNNLLTDTNTNRKIRVIGGKYKRYNHKRYNHKRYTKSKSKYKKNSTYKKKIYKKSLSYYNKRNTKNKTINSKN